MKQKYPKWAPQVVIDRINKRERNKEVDEIYNRLLTHPNMESVWKALISREQKDIDIELYMFATYVMIFKVLSVDFRLSWDFLTIAKRKKIKTKIEKLASELYDLTKIVPSPLLRDIVDFLPEDVVFDLAVRQDENIKELYNKGDRTPSFGGNIIKAFLKTLIKVSKEIDPEYGLLKRPEKKNAGELLFVRRLGIFLYRHYGSFLYEVVANTASVVFDNPDIDKDAVRFAIKGIDMKKVNKYEQMF